MSAILRCRNDTHNRRRVPWSFSFDVRLREPVNYVVNTISLHQILHFHTSSVSAIYIAPPLINNFWHNRNKRCAWNRLSPIKLLSSTQSHTLSRLVAHLYNIVLDDSARRIWKWQCQCLNKCSNWAKFGLQTFITTAYSTFYPRYLQDYATVVAITGCWIM